MGVSEVTADIAAAISLARAPLSARETYLLFILRGMPHFRDIRRLDLFDETYKQVAPDKDGSSTERLIDALYWLAADCFYGAYNETSTSAYYYNTLVPLLAKEGVSFPESPDLSEW
jgi:hypothetical protein